MADVFVVMGEWIGYVPYVEPQRVFADEAAARKYAEREEAEGRVEHWVERVPMTGELNTP